MSRGLQSAHAAAVACRDGRGADRGDPADKPGAAVRQSRVAAGLSGLPPQVQQAAAQVLAQRTSLDPGLTGADIKQAFQSSGLFLEASLASGSVASASAAPDLKAALIVLRQVLTTALGDTAPTTVPPAPTVAPQAPTSATSAQAGTTPGVVVVEQGGEALAVPLGIVAASRHHGSAETPTAASPALAPLLAAEIVSGEGLIASGQRLRSPRPCSNSARQRRAFVVGDAGGYGGAYRCQQRRAQSVAGGRAGRSAGKPADRLERFGDPGQRGLMLSLLPAVAGARVLPADDVRIQRAPTCRRRRSAARCRRRSR